MARSIGNVIADSLQLSLGYADRLLKDVEPERFARFASPGGQPIDSNHPAFVLSHLCIYAPRIIEQLGRDDLAVAVEDQIANTGSKDAKCVDDADGSIYAEMGQVVETFQNGYSNAEMALREAADDLLQQPNPGEGRMVELFPTLGSMHAFYCGGHMMMHLGQFSAWRRMESMGPA